MVNAQILYPVIYFHLPACYSSHFVVRSGSKYIICVTDIFFINYQGVVF